MIKDFIHAIHATPDMGVVVVTGGATGVIDEMLKRGGGSNTLIKAVVPYSTEAWKEFLGFVPSKTVTVEAARSLALQAYLDALRLSPGEKRFGLAVTASLAKHGNERAGREHHMHVAFHNGVKNRVISYQFSGGNREAQENKAVEIVLNILAFELGVAGGLWDEIYDGVVKDTYTRCATFKDGGELFFTSKGIIFVPNEVNTPTELIYPGSFNPLHEGHLEAARIAEEITGKKCTFELAATNVDKPPLDFIAIQDRTDELKKLGKNFVITNTPLFVDKAELFRNATFIVGVDTWARILNKKYGDVDSVLSFFLGYGTKFIVFGRYVDGKFLTASDIYKPNHSFFDMSNSVTDVPESIYKMDISSSAIRAGKNGN